MISKWLEPSDITILTKVDKNKLDIYKEILDAKYCYICMEKLDGFKCKICWTTYKSTFFTEKVRRKNILILWDYLYSENIFWGNKFIFSWFWYHFCGTAFDLVIIDYKLVKDWKTKEYILDEITPRLNKWWKILYK